MKPTVIWDWNGTLLDDLDVCVQAINEMLRVRSLAPMTRARYYETFTFPVRRYYEAIGFDFSIESFDDVAVEFHEAYATVVGAAAIRVDAVETLDRIRHAGARQVILSALEESRLARELDRRGIASYFDAAYGLGDMHAVSKIERGRQLLADLGIARDAAWLVGDTTHDAEVAVELGVRPILVTGGHHSHERLSGLGHAVVPSLRAALDVMGVEVEDSCR